MRSAWTQIYLLSGVKDSRRGSEQNHARESNALKYYSTYFVLQLQAKRTLRRQVPSEDAAEAVKESTAVSCNEQGGGASLKVPTKSQQLE